MGTQPQPRGEAHPEQGVQYQPSGSTHWQWAVLGLGHHAGASGGSFPGWLLSQCPGGLACSGAQLHLGQVPPSSAKRKLSWALAPLTPAVFVNQLQRRQSAKLEERKFRLSHIDFPPFQEKYLHSIAKTERGEREIVQPPVYSPNVCNRQGRARPKSRTPGKTPVWVAGTQVWSHHLLSPRSINRKPDLKQSGQDSDQVL